MLGVVRIFFLVGRFHELWAVVSGSNSVGKAASVIQHFNPNHNGVKYSLAIGGGKLKKKHFPLNVSFGLYSIIMAYFEPSPSPQYDYC